ncbi:hypothetical protein BOO91_17575 [Vibrio navarrensis]|nr:hypothetical protein UF06_04770 [Vibrio sp. S234-5]MBE3662744.1 hypothetical protein [Vibrio navarrensis]
MNARNDHSIGKMGSSANDDTFFAVNAVLVNVYAESRVTIQPRAITAFYAKNEGSSSEGNIEPFFL